MRTGCRPKIQWARIYRDFSSKALVWTKGAAVSFVLKTGDSGICLEKV